MKYPTRRRACIALICTLLLGPFAFAPATADPGSRGPERSGTGPILPGDRLKPARRIESDSDGGQGQGTPTSLLPGSGLLK